jgi:hypothetical protein
MPDKEVGAIRQSAAPRGRRHDRKDRIMSNTSIYEDDFYAWTTRQADLLRAGNFSEADLPNIIEEIETLGRSELRELISRLRVLLLHLLKWQYQPNLQGPSWRGTIVTQRGEIIEHLAESPSLKSRLPEATERAYRLARAGAAAETGLLQAAFPIECPWSFDEMMREDFWPKN